MNSSRHENAHAVLFPAFASTSLSDSVKRFLGNGGCSILLGETREEYLARKMSPERIMTETPETLLSVTEEAKRSANKILVAIDQEIGGICRLHDLVPAFPPADEISNMDHHECERLSRDIAVGAHKMGINCFLAPILDIVTGDNPWLAGRTWSKDPGQIAALSAIYIKTLQANGIAAAAKHFPGYSAIAKDPAVAEEAINVEPSESFEQSFIPFIDAIKTGVEIVMTGPAVVSALDPDNAASVSAPVISILRNQLHFSGLVMSDDLDAKGILRGRPITEIAVDALQAGCDLLLIADIDDQIDRLAAALVVAVENGELAENRLDI
ncbi:glycoside hydrolase family 3 N-terminal domain-containing protein [Desulfopila sp. IMCC35008]|uniref:glycoside hydrolase family 3 N-terminal domain-containing protein n=1 Tax=Desulfopila sp. IMCC35008 TaxID=2653858 RepID=UPI0013D02F9D|nr:glycoside hydrolase family 3 N-terminal domain-containing protein [Desulfopila sp. IMCC35008]